ncbi:hypothetical protein [Pseudobdellovibrio sp. HCB154]|uniref:hypothetical protein n=1 Tax=Pseudobdellovibrio sp. HCB154 TaxID=3386277 RepID=UPI003917287A
MSNAESTPAALNVLDGALEKEIKEVVVTKAAKDEDHDSDDMDMEQDKVHDRFGGGDDDISLDNSNAVNLLSEEDEDFNFDAVENILDLPENEFPKFTLAKNKARFLRMVSWYRQKEEWIEVAPLSGVQKLFKQQTKELEGIRASKMDYEMELETGTLTPSQRSYKRDELKMCRVQEKMAVHLISKLQLKIKSGRR